MVVGCRCPSLPLVAYFRVSVVWHRLLKAMNVAAEVRCPFLELLHCKKKLAIFPSPAGMSLTKLSLGGKN
jgi:hypothetical protein